MFSAPVRFCFIAALVLSVKSYGEDSDPRYKPLDEGTVAEYRKIGAMRFEHKANQVPTIYFTAKSKWDGSEPFPNAHVPFGLRFEKASWMTDLVLKRLAGLKNLRSLSLIETKVSSKGLRELASLKNLYRLELSAEAIADETLRVLNRIGKLHTLVKELSFRDKTGWKSPDEVTVIDLQHASKVTDEGLKELAGFKNLEDLYFTGTQVTGTGLRHLRQLKKLRFLRVSRISDAGLREVVKFNSLVALELYFSAGNKISITANGLKELTKLSNLIQLQLASDGYRFPAIPEKVLTPIRKALPKCQIWKTCYYKHIAPSVQEAYRKIGALRVIRHYRTPPTVCFAYGSKLDLSKPFPDVKVPFGLHFIEWVGMTDEGMKQIAHLNNLVYLHLSTTKVTDKGLKQLAGLKKLARLELENAKITDETLRTLKKFGLLHTLVGANFSRRDYYWGRIPGWQSSREVRVFDLFGSTNVTDAGMKELMDFKYLTHLFLLDTQVTGRGFKHLRDLQHLRELELSGATDEGLKEIARFQSLTSLRIYSSKKVRSQITDTGLMELAKLKNLRRLELHASGDRFPKVTFGGLKKLRQALPTCVMDLQK